MDRNDAFAIPYSWFEKNKTNLSMTDSGERTCWHVPLTTLANGGLAINVSKVGAKADLAPFRFTLNCE